MSEDCPQVVFLSFFVLITLQSSSFGFTPAERKGVWIVGVFFLFGRIMCEQSKTQWLVGSSNAHNTMLHRGLGRVRNQARQAPRRIHNRGRQMGSTSLFFFVSPLAILPTDVWSRADSLKFYDLCHPCLMGKGTHGISYKVLDKWITQRLRRSVHGCERSIYT